MCERRQTSDRPSESVAAGSRPRNNPALRLAGTRNKSVSANLSPTPSIQTLSPFRRSPDVEIPATIEGKIPDWLRGEVVRTCPAVFETNGWRAHHWFDGLGM